MVSCELRADHRGQPLNGGAQVCGIHLLQLDRNRGVEPPFTFLILVCPMREQTAAQHPSEAHERPAFARKTFVTPAVADDLAIKAEDCAPERESVFVWLVPEGGHIDQPVSLGMFGAATFGDRVHLHVRCVKLSKLSVLGPSVVLCTISVRRMISSGDPWRAT